MAVTRIQSALADSTFATYRSSWISFFRFLLAYEWSPLPVRQELFVRYATWLWTQNYAYATIRTYCGSLPSLYIAVGVELSMGRSEFPALARCLQGIRRDVRGPRSKAHITIELLVRFRSYVNVKSVKNLALWAATCVGFFSFLRSGNLVPKLKTAWKFGTHLARSDVSFTERAQSYTYVSPKLANLMGTTSPYPSQSCATPVSVRLMHLTASSPVFTPRSQYLCSRTEDPFGSPTLTCDNLFANSRNVVTLTQTNMDATVYEAEEQLLPLLLEDPTTISSCRVYGSPMPIHRSSKFPKISENSGHVARSVDLQ